MAAAARVTTARGGALIETSDILAGILWSGPGIALASLSRVRMNEIENRGLRELWQEFNIDLSAAAMPSTMIGGSNSCKQAIRAAVEHVRSRGFRDIGSHHILLAIYEVDDELSIGKFAGMGYNLRSIRTAIGQELRALRKYGKTVAEADDLALR